MKEAINVWEKRRLSSEGIMPTAELKKHIDEFIGARVNCALATGYGVYVRNTPMRYSYKDGKFIFITEGGYKFKGLSANPHVCIAIYDENDASSDTRGVTVEGTAEVTQMPKTNKNAKEPTRFMITVTPTLIDYLNSDLVEQGYYRLQRITFS